MVIANQTEVITSIGGQPKQVYWSPDGRQIRAMPDIHTFVRRNNKGEIIEEGIRDANFDKGWLATKPTELKLYCPHCGAWHDTEKEIAKCGDKQRALVKKSLKKLTKDEPTLDNDRISRLESDMGEIKGLLQQLLKGVKS